jgi:predicted PurR-regulated permease PerM
LRVHSCSRRLTWQPHFRNDLQARAPEVQSTLGQYGIHADFDQLKAQAASAIEKGGTDVLKNLVGTLAEVGGMILDIVLALVISLYLLVDGPSFRDRSLAILPPQHRAKALFCRTMSRACWVAICAASSRWR